MAEEDRQRAVKERYAETDKAISQLNVILVYKKLVQGLVYSPTDCEKHLALDAKPHVSVAFGPTRCVPRPSGSHQSGIGSAPLLRELVQDKRTAMCTMCTCVLAASCATHRFLKHRPTRRTSSAC